MVGGRACRVIGGAVIVLAGCHDELPVPALEQQVRDYFSERGIEPRTVRCPPGLRRRAGESLVCDATIETEPVPVVVEVTDDDGHLELRPRYATLVADRVEPEVAQALRGQGITVAEVRCHGTVWVARPGAVRRCEVVDEQGQRYDWTGTFSGEGARHRAKIVPRASDGAHGLEESR